MERNCLLLILLLATFNPVFGQKQVEKTNPLKVYMHYMPWFETPESIGSWGWHWKMNNKNPEVKDATGRRQIASHYYPLIGPYASRDKDVIEYHLLLMKLSGIDGVLINWYGVRGSNGDINDLLKSSDTIVSYTDDYGMHFGVVLEDRFSRSIEDVKANVNYLKENYFNKKEYIRVGEEGHPLVAIFGPITFSKPENWSEIMPSAGENLEFLTLWYESQDAGVNADGEFSWVYQDGNSHINHLNNFYNNRTSQLKTSMGSAYPGFSDFYKQGGAGNGYFYIPHNNGSTLAQTLQKALDNKDKIDMLQLVTWNDFGEGTMLEPTVETGFNYLKQIQKFTGVQYGEEELKLVYKLFQLRKQHKDEPEIQNDLNQASDHLKNLSIAEAESILEEYVLDEVTGFLDKEIKNNPLKVYPNPVKKDELQLEFGVTIKTEGHLFLIDTEGKIVIRKKIAPGTSKIGLPLPKVRNGLYIIKVESKDYRGVQKFTFVD